MTGLALDIVGARLLHPGAGLVEDRLTLSDGLIQQAPVGRQVDLSGYLVLPGIIDLHGDGFERHVAPRRGAMKQMNEGILAAEAEIAANGITTAVMAQFLSWEGGIRGPKTAAQVFGAIAAVKDDLITDLRPQLRFEINLLEDYETLPARVAEWGVNYVVFNDHLPHDRLAKGRRPPRLTGQALKAGRNPDKHFAYLMELHGRSSQVPAALDTLTALLLAVGTRLGSHDDRTAEDRDVWRGRGVRIAEFPETVVAAEAARRGGDSIILGAPNAVRGASHNGNASALDLIAMGLCDALASDYHYPSPRRAALWLAQAGLLSFEAAWGLVSSGPAQVLGLVDRGALRPGLRADLVVLEADTHRIAATVSGGRVSHMRGDVMQRFIAGAS